MSDIVSITINGAEFAGWEGVTITRSIDSVADGFSLSAPFDPSKPGVVDRFRPFGYQMAIVKIDGEIILTGTVETVEAATSADDRALTVGGRSLPGVLIDCAIDGVGYEYKKTSLLTIAQKIVQPFGLQVTASQGNGQALKIGQPAPVPAGASKILMEARCSPGDTVAGFLGQLAQDAGLLLMSDTQGGLVLAKLETGGQPVAAIIEGDGPTLAVSASFDGTQRFSSYKILQQQDGKPDGKATAQDPGVAVYRPTIITGSESDLGNINQAATMRRAIALAGAVGLTASVSGWRTRAGQIWTPGMVVTVKAPGAYILQEATFIVAEATLKFDASAGRTTDLRLVLPATYTGTMPEGYPWV